MEITAKRKKYGGRKKGTPNKISAVAQNDVMKVFKQLGGVKAMTEWAKDNKTEFYKIYAKALPKNIQAPDEGQEVDEEWTVTVRDEGTGRVLPGEAAVVLEEVMDSVTGTGESKPRIPQKAQS